METAADRLRQARAGAGFATAKEACDRFGWTPSTYYGHENGARGLTRTTAQEYARAFRVSIDWLLLGSKNGLSDEDQQILEEFNALPDDLAAALRSVVRALARRAGEARGGDR